MRPDRIAPLTWLLAAAAAWALLGAALAAAGMGGRVAASDGEAIAAQPLPQLIDDTRAAPPAPYTAFAARPPFAQDRRPHPFSLPGNGSADAHADAGAFDYVLTSVMIAPRFRMAIIEPSQGGESIRVREGQSAEGLGGWRLAELRPHAAVFDGPGGRRELELRIWTGDEAPVAGAPQPAVPPQPANAAQSDAAAPDVASEGPATAPAPTQVQQQMEAIRRRIEARRAQLRREAAQQPGAPARNP